MGRTLRIRPADDKFDLLDDVDVVLASGLSRAAALSTAIEALSADSGGEIWVLDDSGKVVSRQPVNAASPPPARARRSRPTGHTPPVEAPPVLDGVELRPDQGEPSEQQHPTGGVFDSLEKAAGHVDAELGKPDPQPESPLGEVKVSDIAPNRLTSHPMVRLVNRHVSLAAAWTALVGAVFAEGTFSAVVQAVRRGASGSTTLGDYASVYEAFIGSSALCASVGLAVWAVLTQRATSYGAVFAWILATAVASGLLSQMGLLAPSWEVVAANARAGGGGGPLSMAFSLLSGFLTFYGFLSFMTGIGVGWFVGLCAARIEEAASGRELAL